jgi:hypothetical protein
MNATGSHRRERSGGRDPEADQPACFRYFQLLRPQRAVRMQLQNAGSATNQRVIVWHRLRYGIFSITSTNCDCFDYMLV